MTYQKEPETIFSPFGWRALAWAALVEAAVKTGEYSVDLPAPYASVASILAGQTIEASRIMFGKALRYLEKMRTEDRQDDIPASIRQYITEPVVEDAIIMLTDEHKKWLSAVDKVLKRNRFGLQVGVKPLHLL